MYQKYTAYSLQVSSPSSIIYHFDQRTCTLIMCHNIFLVIIHSIRSVKAVVDKSAICFKLTALINSQLLPRVLRATNGRRYWLFICGT